MRTAVVSVCGYRFGHFFKCRKPKLSSRVTFSKLKVQEKKKVEMDFHISMPNYLLGLYTSAQHAGKLPEFSFRGSCMCEHRHTFFTQMSDYWPSGTLSMGAELNAAGNIQVS